MQSSSKKINKRYLGMTGIQWGILIAAGMIFCLLFSIIVLYAYFQYNPLPSQIPPEISPVSSILTDTATPSATPTSSPTPTATSTPTVTSTATATTTPSPTPTATPGPAQPPDTYENIHVAQIFNRPGSDPGNELGKVDLVWGSAYPNQPEGVFNLYYYPFDRDADGEKGGLHHDINYFLANHPDWIEYKCDQKTIAYEYGDPNVPLDVTNPDVLDYMLETYIIPAINSGYQGIAFDNVDFNNYGERCGVWKNGKWFSQPNYTANIFTWAEFMYSHLHSLNTSVAMNSPFDPDHQAERNKLFQYLDILVDENGFTNGGKQPKDYLSPGNWLTNMESLKSLDTLGKGFVSINQMPEDFYQVTRAEKQWVLANYLLVKGNHSYVAIMGPQQYGYAYKAPEYSAPIGHALNPMYQFQNLYVRDYSNGMAIVNPSPDQSYTINLLPGSYQDLYGNDVDNLTIDPLSGIILIKK